MAELGVRNPTDKDCQNVRFICSVASRRAAHLASAGIAALLKKMGQNNITVGVDGSVYRYHPLFHDLMVEKISTLQPHKVSLSFFIQLIMFIRRDEYFLESFSILFQFDLMLSEDGSGRGAALVAAVASQQR